MVKWLTTVVSFAIQHTIECICIWLLLYGSITTVLTENNNLSWWSVLYLFSLSLCFILFLCFNARNSVFAPLIRIPLYFMMTLALPILFLTTNEVIKSYHYVLYDPQLTTIDQVLFPFFEKGQIAIEIDRNSVINPRTFHGKLLNDYFEIIYITFYLWGYLSFILCVLDILILWFPQFLKQKFPSFHSSQLFSLQDEEERRRIEQTYQLQLQQKIINMEYLLILWSSTFSLIFLFNYLIPGKSPRIYFSSEYQNDIIGFGFTQWWKSHVDRDDSSGTFPSGHCGETFAVAFGIFYSHKTFGKLVFLMAFLITLSTLWNRYHYLTDLLSGILCCFCGYVLANCYLHELNRKNTNPSRFHS